MLTRKQQTQKHRKPSTRKISNYREYCDFINDIADGVCQICGSAAIAEFHHSSYGSFKDDKTIVGVCLQCHLDAHKEKHGDVNLKAVEIGAVNWEKFSEMQGLV